MSDFTPASQNLGDERPLKAMQLRHELSAFLSSAVADAGTVSGGGGMGAEDIYLSIGGERFHISIPWADPA